MKAIQHLNLRRESAAALAKKAIGCIRSQLPTMSELDTSQVKVDALKRLQGETAAELDALLPAILDRAPSKENYERSQNLLSKVQVGSTAL